MAAKQERESLPEVKVKGDECIQTLLAESLQKIHTLKNIPTDRKELLIRLGKSENISIDDLVEVNHILQDMKLQTTDKDLTTISFLQLVYHIRSLPTYFKTFQSKNVYNIMRLAMDLCFLYPNQNPEKIIVELKDLLTQEKQPAVDFESLTLSLILAQLQAYEQTEKYLEKIVSSQKGNDKTIILVFIDLIRALIFRRQGRYAESHHLFSTVCLDLVRFQDVEAMLYVLNEWAYVFYRMTELKKATSALVLIRDNVDGNECLNIARTLFYLFYITKYEKPKAEKIQYMENLLEIPNTVLQNTDLLHLHFYAGNFYSTIQVNFAESIKHFTESNYYLMKSWEQLLQNNAFLHDHLPQDELIKVQPIFELRLKDLLSENSLQINQFVEYLDLAYNEQNKLYEKMQELSLTDSLTGLRNRRYLLNNIPQMLFLARRHQNPISFIMLDIDDFKKINDIYGHVAGDRILHDLSDMIQPMFRKSDIIIRYGGEEILLVLFDAQTEDALRLTEQIRIMVEKKTFTFQDCQIHLTISGGISTHFFDESDKEDIKLEDMISLADHALYYSKKHGKNMITTSEQLANKFLMNP